MSHATQIPRRAFLAVGKIAAVGACADGARPARGPTMTSSSLPSPRQDRAVGLDAALAERRSIRDFSDEPVGEEAISRLLWAAQGVTAAWGGRTAPSAGALYPIEVYVATVDRLRRYLPDDHGTVDVAREDRRPRIAQATGQETPTAAPILIVITGVVPRTAAKYGDRAERYVQLEAGHVCQNLLLQATSLGLAAVPMGAFSDDELRDALGAGEDELPLYVVPIGHPGEGG
jgi:SagB-type dehydrogenase family enzyme